MKPADEYFINQKEPYQSIMLYVRSVILNTLPEVEERFSYKIPFYNIGKKPFPVLKNDNKRKQVRSIQLRTLGDLDQENFFALLHLASNQLKKSKKAWFIG